MRVISGSAKGRNLQSVPGDSTRPITDRVKEALFNIFGADIVDADFLDLFGGTGGVGIEALSRGAAHAVFVEKNRKAQETIKANLASHAVERSRPRSCAVMRSLILQGVPRAVSLHLHRAAAVSTAVGRCVEVDRRAARLAGRRRRNHRADSSEGIRSRAAGELRGDRAAQVRQHAVGVLRAQARGVKQEAGCSEARWQASRMQEAGIRMLVSRILHLASCS